MSDELTLADLTGPQARALGILASEPDGYEWAAGRLADLMWPDKYNQRINGPWGLGPTGAPMAGGRMLTRLRKLGLVREEHHYGYSRYFLTIRARTLVAAVETPKETQQ